MDLNKLKGRLANKGITFISSEGNTVQWMEARKEKEKKGKHGDLIL